MTNLPHQPWKNYHVFYFLAAALPCYSHCKLQACAAVKHDSTGGYWAYKICMSTSSNCEGNRCGELFTALRNVCVESKKSGCDPLSTVHLCHTMKRSRRVIMPPGPDRATQRSLQKVLQWRIAVPGICARPQTSVRKIITSYLWYGITFVISCSKVFLWRVKFSPSATPNYITLTCVQNPFASLFGLFSFGLKYIRSSNPWRVTDTKMYRFTHFRW